MRLCGRARVLYDPRKLKVACVYSWAQAAKVCSGNYISKLTAVAQLNVANCASCLEIAPIRRAAPKTSPQSNGNQSATPSI